MRANTAGLSKRGRHNQSIDPSRLTSDADELSERNAYSAIATPLQERCPTGLKAGKSRSFDYRVAGASTGGRPART